MTPTTPASGHPPSPVAVNDTAPVPRRVRAVFDDRVLVDTVRATYVWERPEYPQFFVPEDDVDGSMIGDPGPIEDTDRGLMRRCDVRSGDRVAPGAARYLESSTIAGLDRTYRFDWGAIDAWFEEDEEIFVHPRNPYTRVDALRSSRHVRVEKDGVVLAESDSPVAVFETGLRTRWYLDRTAVRWEHLEASDTRTRCPYKGVTSDYWSARAGGTVHADVAWAYDLTTREALPIAGLVCFYDEKVDVIVE